MKGYVSFEEENIGRDRRISWVELDRIRWELEAKGKSLRYLGNHMDDREVEIWAVFRAEEGPRYCVRLR